MKYIDAELLREKIAEQMESLPREVGRGAGAITSKGYGMMQAFQIMRSIIDSLQEEQPKVDLVAELKHHLDTTPKEQLEKEWKELEPWDNIGPTVQEFLYGKQPEVDLETEKKEGRTDCSSQGEVPTDSLATQSYENNPNDLEEAAKEYAKTTFKKPYSDNPDEEVTIVEPDKYAGFIAGAKWQYQKDRAKFAQLKAKEWSDGYDEGIAKGKEKMMKEAVEGYVNYYEDSGGILMAEAQVGCPYHNGDKVRIIVCKKED